MLREPALSTDEQAYLSTLQCLPGGDLKTRGGGVPMGRRVANAALTTRRTSLTQCAITLLDSSVAGGYPFEGSV